MTIDEVIKHAEEVAKKQENNAKNYPRPDKSVRGSGKKYNAYIKSAEEHRQLAEWLKDYKRLLEQESKTGHWILVEYPTGVEAFGVKEMIAVALKCSECGKEVDISDGDFKLCPYCGAKVQEVEE